MKVILITICFFFVLSCKKELQNKDLLNQNNSKQVCDSTKGFFVTYPAIIKEDYLEIESEEFYHFTLNKILTKDSTKYRLDSYNSAGGGFDVEIPLHFGFELGNLHLDSKIDKQFEKEFGQTKGVKCVVKFFVSKTRWNYEYSIKKDTVILKNIYFYFNIPKMIYIKGVKDTVAQFVKFPINENAKIINSQKIYSINNFENWEKFDKIEKWNVE